MTDLLAPAGQDVLPGMPPAPPASPAPITIVPASRSAQQHLWTLIVDSFYGLERCPVLVEHHGVVEHVIVAPISYSRPGYLAVVDDTAANIHGLAVGEPVDVDLIDVNAIRQITCRH